jgi:hypothetical protein
MICNGIKNKELLGDPSIFDGSSENVKVCICGDCFIYLEIQKEKNYRDMIPAIQREEVTKKLG